jgi:hypothetical protein
LKQIATALTLVIAAAMAHAQVDPNRTVVVINGEEIKGAEYYRRMEHLPGVGKIMGEGLAEFPPGFLTIEQLITERLIMQLAREKGVFPTDTEVQAELGQRLKINPKLLEEIGVIGMTRADLEYQIRFDLAQFKLITAGITVTDQEVDKFYKDNPGTFTNPKRVKLRVIAVQNEAERNAVDADLKKGTAFAEVARKHSVDVTRHSGGEFGVWPVNDLNEHIRKAVEAMKVGQTSNWLSAQDAQMKFLLEEVLPEKREDLTPELRQGIRRRLMLDRGRVRNDIQKDMLAMRKKANIDIKSKEFAEAYKRFIESYLRQVEGAGR